MKKRQKSRLAMYIIGGISAISLGSIGFASWVLTGVEHASENISVSVGQVENNSLVTTIYGSTEGSDLALNFDNVSGGGSNKIFSEGGSEDLAFSIKFKIDGAVASKLNTVEFTFDTGIAGTSSLPNPLMDSTGTNDAIDYLCYPWLSTRKVDFTYTSSTKTFTLKDGKNPNGEEIAINVDSSTSDTTLIATATFTFKWGKAFSSVNPGNTTITGSMTREILIQRLNAFNSAFSTATTGDKFLAVKVTPTAK